MQDYDASAQNIATEIFLLSYIIRGKEEYCTIR